jgi:hypothetical protein
MKTELKWQRVRAGWYETGNEIEGAFVIYEDSDRRGSWLVYRWSPDRWNNDRLELAFIESAGTFRYAKELAQLEADHYPTAREYREVIG